MIYDPYLILCTLMNPLRQWSFMLFPSFTVPTLGIIDCHFLGGESVGHILLRVWLGAVVEEKMTWFQWSFLNHMCDPTLNYPKLLKNVIRIQQLPLGTEITTSNEIKVIKGLIVCCSSPLPKISVSSGSILHIKMLTLHRMKLLKLCVASSRSLWLETPSPTSIRWLGNSI